MPHYISLLKWTDQGIRTVKDGPKRAEAAHKLAQQLGGKFQVWFTFGEYDLVSVGEFPDDAAAQKFILGIASQGNVRTTTLKAWSEEEGFKIIGSLP